MIISSPNRTVWSRIDGVSWSRRRRSYVRFFKQMLIGSIPSHTSNSLSSSLLLLLWANAPMKTNDWMKNHTKQHLMLLLQRSIQKKKRIIVFFSRDERIVFGKSSSFILTNGITTIVCSWTYFAVWMYLFHLFHLSAIQALRAELGRFILKWTNCQFLYCWKAYFCIVCFTKNERS